MTSECSVTSVGFLSHDGVSQIKGLLWAPERAVGAQAATPRGIIQIVHGMAEHVGRYDEFARFLVGHGFVVCASDHVGHGKSVASTSDLGCLPADNGKNILIEDMHALRRMVAARYARQIPYVMFGHSMGSFVVRAYIARYAEGLAAAVICGTGQQSLMVSKIGNFVARRIATSKGSDYRSDLLHNMGAGAFSKQISQARTPFDWISIDPAVVDAYSDDELCGFVFSAGGYAALTDLTGEIASNSCAAKVPPELPLLFIAGEQDPVGAYGKGVHAAAEQLRGVGVQHIDEKLYAGMRHEILNEPDRLQVFTDVASWIEEQICQKPTS